MRRSPLRPWRFPFGLTVDSSCEAARFVWFARASIFVAGLKHDCIVQLRLKYIQFKVGTVPNRVNADSEVASLPSKASALYEPLKRKPFECHMDAALEEARFAAARGEVPVGAAVVDSDGRMLALAGNRTREHCDPTAHAEVLAVRQACGVLNSDRLVGCSIYVTLEPCPMCASAISHARISRLYFGASDPKGGGVEHGVMVYSHNQCNHVPEVYGGIRERESARLLSEFFKDLRRTTSDR